MKSGYLVAVFIILVSAGFMAFGTRASSDEGCVTKSCHASLLKAKTVHPAAQMGCNSCHQAISTQHPQKGRKTFKLTQEVPALCYGCHDAFGKKKHIHPPVKDGMCTTCHNPHASDQPKLLVQPEKDLCLMCHPDKLKEKYLHSPASTGDCTMCHNPHESDNDALTVKTGPDLCFTCHFDMQDTMKKKDVHPAVLMGCTSCHNPHGGPYKWMLPAGIPQLCYQCHSDIQTRVTESKDTHPPVQSEKSCLSCHSPHATDTEKLLPEPQKELCLSCHTKIITKADTSVHGPIKGPSGKCTPCHNPHGSPYIKLLVKEFPDDIYTSYTDKEYELCFSCHDRTLVSLPETSSATGFRDGDRNLHYLHVDRKEKSRSCILCHSPHASRNPDLIRNMVPFGKWEFPLNFVKTDTGGTCLPACHQRVYYDRKSPGKIPESLKPVEKGRRLPK